MTTTDMREERERQFSALWDALAQLERAPMDVDGLYVVDDETRMKPAARDRLMAELEAELALLMNQELDANPAYAKLPNGNYVLREHVKPH